MRVKVKLTSSPQAVYKVDLGEGPLTLARVQEVITQHVSDAHLSEDAQLSLNKKVQFNLCMCLRNERVVLPGILTSLTLWGCSQSPISTDPNATLQSLGVCSGDLLWILTGEATCFAEHM